MKWLLRIAGLLLVLACASGAWLWNVNFRDGVDVSDPREPAGDAAQLARRGAYLARIGNCLACHTKRGGEAGAGGRAIETGFGSIYSSNLTPDLETGIGAWNANQFWRALHHGRSASGRLLAPAFPYTHLTLITREDSDALYHYFHGLPPVRSPNRESELRWPFGTQLALAVWRARYFRPAAFEPDPARDSAWNRGAYLTRAVAHCSACHGRRDALGGGDWQDLSGNLLQAQGWWAPALNDAAQADMAGWQANAIAGFLKAGFGPQGGASGPMAEVILRGTQYLSEADALALAQYLRDLPASTRAVPPGAPRPTLPASEQALNAGRQIYEERCATCHGQHGQGVAHAYPALAGNRAVTLDRVENLVQIVLFGGFNPATDANPRPYGMPPFAPTLDDREVAAVLSYVRSSWGNGASAVRPFDVHTLREASTALSVAPR